MRIYEYILNISMGIPKLLDFYRGGFIVMMVYVLIVF